MWGMDFPICVLATESPVKSSADTFGPQTPLRLHQPTRFEIPSTSPSSRRTERRFDGRHQQKTPALVIQSHEIVELDERGSLLSRVVFPPLAKNTHRHSTKHAQDPAGIPVSDARAILLGRDIQPLVKTVFDPPVLALELEPLGRIKIFSTGQQVNRLLFSSGGLAMEPAGSGGSRETKLLRGDLEDSKVSDFMASPVFLLRSGGVLRRRPRGKRPPGWR